MQLTKKEMLGYWKQAVNSKMRVWAHKRKPRFHVAQIVQIVKKEPDLGEWTYMDTIRKERKGERGIIIDINALADSYVPEHRSNYTYKIRFSDGKTINFAEEHLTRVR